LPVRIRLAADAGDGDVAGQDDVAGEQDAERGAAKRDVAGLVELRVVIDQQAETGDEQLRVRRVVFESHFAGPLQPCLAGAGRAIGRDLQEVGGDGGQAVEVGLGLINERLVGGGVRCCVRLRARRCCRRQNAGGGQNGQKVTSCHEPVWAAGVSRPRPAGLRPRSCSR
jgi:hypothetical protein